MVFMNIMGNHTHNPPQITFKLMCHVHPASAAQQSHAKKAGEKRIYNFNQ